MSPPQTTEKPLATRRLSDMSSMSRRPTILVVEDHAHVMELMKEILEPEGVEVRGAADANTALEMLEDWTPDLILMDVQLPGMDGAILTRRLKGQESLKNVPIVAVTAYTDPGDREWFLGTGCDGYIPKPLDPHTFREEVLFYLNDAPLAS